MGLFNTREISGAAEGTFGEYASAPASATFAKRYPVTNASFTPDQDRQADMSLQVRANDSRAGYLLPRTGNLELTFNWAGHGAVTTGALTESWQQDLLSDALGGGDVTQVGGALTGSPTATSLPFSGATLVRGGGIRVGSKGDAKGDGQFAIVGSAITTPASLLTALPAAPAAADVLYAAQIAYPAETGHTSRRFLFAFPETNAQYILHGCQAASISFSLPMGGIPTCTISYRVAYWQQYAKTVPVVSTLEACEAAPIAGGSVFYQTFGTTTRATIDPSEIGLTLDMGLSEIPGLGAGVAYQTITQMYRTQCVPTFTAKVPWSTTYDALYDADGGDSTYKHILVTCNTTQKRAIGFYLPRAFIKGPRPTFEDFNGRVYHNLVFQGAESTDTTNELTRSAIRFLSA